MKRVGGGMEFSLSDELLGTVMPIVVYWVYSGLYMMFGSYDNYRLHSRQDEHDKNLVTKPTVIKGVLLQQALQAVVAIILFKVPPSLPFPYFYIFVCINACHFILLFFFWWVFFVVVMGKILTFLFFRIIDLTFFELNVYLFLFVFYF